MTSFEDLIAQLAEKIPELASVHDLVEAGIYKTEQAACNARRLGKGPNWVRIPCRGIVYPKQGVIEFLEKCKNG